MTYAEYGAPESLTLTDVPMPKVAPGAVLIRVERASVNPVDWKLMAGGLDALIDITFPAIPGWDVSGVVEQVGPDVPEFQVGDRVASYARKDVVAGGTYAEFVAVPAASVAKVPDDVDLDSAAGLPLTGLTALRSLEALDLTEEDTLLIHGASGGVGFLGAQLARSIGARVYGTASEENHAKLEAIGVTPVAYGEGLAERLQDVAPGGVSAVADFVGGQLETTQAVLREGGRHVSIADPAVLGAGGQLIWVRPDGARLQQLLQLVQDGTLRVDVDRTFPLAEAAEAMKANMNGSRGKVLIDATR